MEEKPDDDEIPNYITELNTVRANQGITPNPKVVTKTDKTSQINSLIKSAKLKRVYSFMPAQFDQINISFNNFYGGTK